LIVIALIIVAIFIVIGTIVGSLIAFMVINKITKRHLDLLQRRADTQQLIVADLDDPAQVREANVSDVMPEEVGPNEYQKDKLEKQRLNAVANFPEKGDNEKQRLNAAANFPEKGKGFDDDYF